MAVSRTEIYLLGPPRIERDGQVVDVDTRKAIALLAFLTLTGETQQRSTLAALFWPEGDESRGRTALRRTLFVLGQAIGKEWLQADRQTVTLLHGTNLWIDVMTFRGCLADCLAADDPTPERCHNCLPQLEGAVKLYRGELLEGFTLADSAEFSDWHLFQAESLRREYGQALKMLMRCYSQEGHFEQAITYGRRWLALDTLHEPAHRELMRTYAWAGQRAHALRQYETCARVLQDELSTEPTNETTTLYQTILAGELQRLREPQWTPTTLADHIRHNLPLATTTFIGREVELERLQQLLDDPDCRLLSLLGAGGVGKTRLAVELARRYVPVPNEGDEAHWVDHRFRHGIYLVPLAPLQESEFLAATIADAIGFTFYGREDHRTQLFNYLREKRMLLILDNFEHLIEESISLLGSILQVAPHVQLIVTSRERLNLQGECLLEIVGLACPLASQPLAAQAETSAVQLFIQRAKRVRPDFTPSTAEMRAIAHICRLVDGLPLGIELASAWVRVLSSEQISAEIEKNLDFLSTTMRDVPARHRSLRAVFEHSWQLLSTQEREAFCRLSVFRGQFDRAAAEDIAKATLPLLLALVDKSFLRREEQEGSNEQAVSNATARYALPEVLHPYAEEKLADVPQEAEATRQRHAIYYAAFVQERSVWLKGNGQAQALTELSETIENVRAAWRWALEQHEEELLDQFLEGLYRFYEMRGWLQEGEEAFGRAAEVLEAQATGNRLLAETLSRQGRLQTRLAQFERAHQTLVRSREILQEQNAPREIASILSNIAIIVEVTGDLEQAETLQRETLDIFEEVGDRWGIANSLLRLGNVAYARGDYQEAWNFYEQSLHIRSTIGDRRGIALCLNNLGSIVDTLGDYEEAKDLYRESVAIKRELGDRRGVAYSLNNLGYVNYLMGNYQAALGELEESLAVFKEIGDRKGTAYALTNLGNVAYDLQQYTQAEELYEENLKVFQEIGDRSGLAHALNHLGETSRMLGAYKDARAYYREALQTAMAIRAFPIVLEILVGVAALFMAEGDFAQALTLLQLVHNYPTGRKQTQDRAAKLMEELSQHLNVEDESDGWAQADTTLEAAVEKFLS